MNPAVLAALLAEDEVEQTIHILTNQGGAVIPVPPEPPPSGLNAFQSDTFQNDTFE